MDGWLLSVTIEEAKSFAAQRRTATRGAVSCRSGRDSPTDPQDLLNRGTTQGRHLLRLVQVGRAVEAIETGPRSCVAYLCLISTPKPEGRGSSLKDVNQFALLGTRRMGPLFTSQFFGAFNDNLFKAGLVAMLVFGGVVLEQQVDLFVNVATGIFVLPFFLFSATAGALADKFEKSRLVRHIKLAEIGIALLIVATLYLRDPVLMLLVLFLLGAQSTFYSPLKWSLLPQHLRSNELVGGNGLVKMGTFVAILIGTIVGTQLGAQSALVGWLAFMVVAVAVVGYLASLAIPKAPADPGAKPEWNPFAGLMDLFKVASERKPVFQAIVGISWSWLLGSLYLAQMGNLSKLHLGGNESVLTLFLVTFTLSVAGGSLLCEALGRRRVEIGLVPLGAAGMSLFGFDSYFAIQAIHPPAELVGAMEFLRLPGSWRLLIDFLMVGVFFGVYVVPMQAMMQARTPQDRRARVIAANNVINAIFMVIGAGLAVFWLTYLGYSIPLLLVAVSVVNILVAIYIFNQVPEFTFRFLMWVVTHSLFRVRHFGLEHVPERGPAMIVSNHVTKIDALVLGGSVSRPIRFIMSNEIYQRPILKSIFKTNRTIPIAPKTENPEAYENAFKEIRAALENRELLCIFPEGRLTPDGEMGEFKAGIKKIVDTTPVPVIPMALRGLWGNFFSLHGKGPWRGSLRPRSRVDVLIAAPVKPEAVSPMGLRTSVQQLLASS